ncbi:hypothetical protein J437_LFUL011537 [Ladona fulva]|uniref:Thyroglobulin type-1 domain-containing protein n=1 Tax=Ladona fulva TaxID=123851 RepID=A0A8K0KB65_LADFU|nr:hypothetical protein J437_LFUL011537 [Ladona fulva]
MTCACSKEVNSIIALGLRSDVSLHCSSNGNYETLQCDDGLCWCADYKTGLPLYSIVPEKMMNLLPCYQDDDSFQYLRECESAAVATGRIKDFLFKHGTKFSNMDSDRCDFDGSYGKFQVVENQLRCTWKDRSYIQGYATQLSEINNVTCNCARDSIIFKLSGKIQRLECQGNGNYAKKQFSEGKAFCVDSDGYPTTGFIDLDDCPE